jgi:hypothetical protein
MTITLTRKEAQQVLDAMIPYQQKVIATTKEYGVTVSVNNEIETAIEILRARLSAPESKPVAWNIKHNRPPLSSDNPHEVVAVIKREWQGLTDEETQKCLSQGVDYGWLGIARAIEAKLKEKNHE